MKDELSKQDRPIDFTTFANIAIRIDNRIYEYRIEKKGDLG